MRKNIDIIKEDTSGWNTDANGKKWEDYDTIVCPDGYVLDMQVLLVEQDRAKAALVHLAPAFGGFVSKLRFVYTFRVKTQATDGYNLFVNPQFTNKLDFSGKVFVMAHEVMHCLLNHMRRGRGHDPHKSNVAADYEVNASLVDVDFCKVSTIRNIGALYDEKYTDWGYEKIYDSNPVDPTKSSQSNASQAGQAGQQQQNQQGQSGKGQQGQSGQGGQQGQSGQSGQSGQGGQQGSQGGSGGGGNQQYSADYIAGWNKAIEDYKKGKIKI